MNSYPVVIIIAKKKRELSFVTLSLSLCVHSLLSSRSLVVVCFHFSPTKVGVRYKNKNSLPSSLSRVDESMLSSSAQNLCIVIKGLHEHFISTVFFTSSSPRVVSSSSTREREKERKRRARKNDGRKFCIYKIRETWKKNKSLLLLFCRDSREREIGSETRCIITQFSVRNRRLRVKVLSARGASTKEQLSPRTNASHRVQEN